MGDLVWLASYPKSGNTWFRVLLSNLMADAVDPVLISRLTTGVIASARETFDEYVGVASSDLTPEEIDAIRPALYRAVASGSGSGRSYHKVHDAFLPSAPGREAVLPADVTHAGIYLVRNPLDVAVSYAHHASVAPGRAIAWMNDRDHCLAGNPRRIDTQLRQRMLTWHEHVASWLDHTDFPVHLVRYEDLSSDPQATFAGAARFLDLPDDPARIATAVRHSAFEELQQQEREAGFAERPATSRTFFRQGRVGGWRSVLDEREIAELVDHHGTMMMRLGYLDDDGSPQ